LRTRPALPRQVHLQANPLLDRSFIGQHGRSSVLESSTDRVKDSDLLVIGATGDLASYDWTDFAVHALLGQQAGFERMVKFTHVRALIQ